MGLSIYGHFPILLRRDRRFAAKKTEKGKNQKLMFILATEPNRTNAE